MIDLFWLLWYFFLRTFGIDQIYCERGAGNIAAQPNILIRL